MTRTRTAIALLVLLLCAAGVAFGVASIPSPVAAPAAAPAVVELHRIDAIPADQPADQPAAFSGGAAAAVADVPVADVDATFLAQLFGPDTDYAPDHAAALVTAAHRVCEGITADVPVVDMAAVLTTAHGFTDDEARTFIALAADTYCGSLA